MKRKSLNSQQIRHETIGLSCVSGAGHLAPSLSPVEILTVLFRDFLKFEEGQPRWEGRDRFIFSKGHGAYAYYVILNKLGFLPDNELNSFYNGASIKGCLTSNLDYMIEASTGSLGHGLPLAVGMAKAFKIQGMNNRVVCLVGDGEMQEGSNFEALQFAVKFKLDNLLMIVDGNQIQAMDRIEDVALDLDHLGRVLSAYSGEANFLDVDGHDEICLTESLTPFFEGKSDGVTIMVARTVKGKGLSLIEDSSKYHFRCPTQDGYVWEEAL
jgi:transketolase